MHRNLRTAAATLPLILVALGAPGLALPVGLAALFALSAVAMPRMQTVARGNRGRAQ